MGFRAALCVKHKHCDVPWCCNKDATLHHSAQPLDGNEPNDNNDGGWPKNKLLRDLQVEKMCYLPSAHEDTACTLQHCGASLVFG